MTMIGNSKMTRKNIFRVFPVFRQLRECVRRQNHPFQAHFDNVLPREFGIAVRIDEETILPVGSNVRSRRCRYLQSSAQHNDHRRSQSQPRHGSDGSHTGGEPR